MKNELGVIGLVLTVAIVPAAEMRTWTFEKSGKTMQGEVINFVGTNMVTLKGADGKTFSVPIAYLTESNRVYLAAEQANKWKEVEVMKLEGTASAGRYKKCSVRGKGVDDVILIDLLPPSVETILNNRNQQAAQIAELQSWVEGGARELRRAEAAVHDANIAAGYGTNVGYAVKESARVEVEEAQANLSKLEAAYSKYNAETKAATTVRMKKTSLVYDGLPVWECFDSRKRHQ